MSTQALELYYSRNSVLASRGDMDDEPIETSFNGSLGDFSEDEENRYCDDDIKTPVQPQPQSHVFDIIVPHDHEVHHQTGGRHVQSLADLDKRAPSRKATQLYSYTPQQRIKQVQKGEHIDFCVSMPPQKLTKGAEELQDSNSQTYLTLNTGYKKLDDGKLEMINEPLLKKQKQVFGYLVKQFGSMILSGKSITSISLPISIFEPKSLLERLADIFVYAPHFLEKAGRVNNTLEQFKLAFTFYLTMLATDLNPEKPFNPIIGETFQGIVGGCPSLY